MNNKYGSFSFVGHYHLATRFPRDFRGTRRRADAVMAHAVVAHAVVAHAVVVSPVPVSKHDLKHFSKHNTLHWDRISNFSLFCHQNVTFVL